MLTMATTAIAPIRSLLRVAEDVPCKQKEKKKTIRDNQFSVTLRKQNKLIKCKDLKIKDIRFFMEMR